MTTTPTWGSIVPADALGIAAIVSLDLATKRSRDECSDRVPKANPSEVNFTREAGSNCLFMELTAPIAANDLETAPAVLDRLVLDWIRLCESIGGLSAEKQGLRAVSPYFNRN